MSERYRRCIIDPRVHELTDGSGWTAEVYVAQDVGSDTIDHRFVLRGKYDTQSAALSSAVALGKREIDRGLPDPEIASVFSEQTRLPSTHQSGFGSFTDDVAENADGSPTKVPTSGNPDDRF
jgi:hypothetical protein